MKIIYITGVSGSGKTTIGEIVSRKTGIPFYDGDDFHPHSNIAKMKSGEALNDNDRNGWLRKLNALAKQKLNDKGAIIASSALKESYRQILASGLGEQVHWVFLQGGMKLISDRMEKRNKHFMPLSLLQSQFDTLEPPEYGIYADISQEPELIANQIIEKLEL